MTGRTILLTGAPEFDSLEWDDTTLTSSFESPVRRFLGEAITPKSTTTTTQTSFALPKWRSLTLPAVIVDAQSHGHESAHSRQLVSFQDAPGSSDTRELEHLKYHEYSLAVLQDLDSSQIATPDGTFADGKTTFVSGSFSGTFDTDQSLLQSNESLSTHSSDRPEQQVVNFAGPFEDLKRIPTAPLLQAIHPQTMTVNIVASVISVQPARTVRLRKRAGEMDVIEVLLGDETKAGFCVSFWVIPVDSEPADKTSSHRDGLRQLLRGLRRGDVLLLTHIALQHYQNTVTGQSLSRRITRNNTTVTVLSNTVQGLSPLIAAKVQRVRDWAKDFIGLATKRAASPEFDRRVSRSRLELPPETQSPSGG